MSHGVGIDTGKAMLVRGGVHGENDIVPIGAAPNVAAKLSELRDGKSTHVTSEVYGRLREEVKHTDGRSMWDRMGSREIGGKSVTYYGSSWHWRP